MIFELPALPYALNALEPYISKETLEYHYGKHHKAYVDNLNKLVANDPQLANLNLEDLIKTVPAGGIFNNAAQVWNHTFYWNCLKPNGGGLPTGDLLAAITQDFGSFEAFKEKFSQTALTTFGSGWAWLIKNSDNQLEIVSTSNADTPLRHKQIALLTCDVWEHAYYIDYRNLRAKYIEEFWKLINWDFVAKNFL